MKVKVFDEGHEKDLEEVINQFILDVITISDNINSDNWNGEDVMGIFFNEFNRYKKNLKQDKF